MKTRNFFIILCFLFCITKEFLPLSYEVFVILGAIIVFLFVKKSMTPMLHEFFKTEKENIFNSFKKKIETNVKKLAVTKTFFPIEDEIREIVLEPVSQKVFAQKTQNEINLIITSRLNSLVRKIKSYK